MIETIKCYVWVVCEDCGLKIVQDLQEHEKLIVKSATHTPGECCICNNLVHLKITVEQRTHEWLQKFTFNKKFSNSMAESTKCTLCCVTASHHILYTNLLEHHSWNGAYCTKCFIIKLQGMYQVHKKRLVKAVVT